MPEKPWNSHSVANVLFFLKMGIEFDSDSRKLIIDTSVKDFKVAILRTWDIPKFVNYGAADIGIVGKDILYETNLDNNYYEALDLKLGLCRMSLASLEDQLPANKKLKVAYKYPNFAKKYFSSMSRDMDLLILKAVMIKIHIRIVHQCFIMAGLIHSQVF